MNGLNINYEQTILLGKEIMQKADEFNDVINKIEEKIFELNEVWKGEDANNFINDLSNDTKEMKKYSMSINELGLLLQKVANTYSEISNNNIF